LHVRGVQGHVAYPEKSRNPIHAFAPALAELAAARWDEGNDAFPPTSFQISNLNSGTGADNVIPGDLRAVFNFRFGTASTSDALRARVEEILARHGIEIGEGASTLEWRVSGDPFASAAGPLRATVLASIAEHCGIAPEQSTGGGTSDGRFIAPLGAQVVELGVINATIHKVNESVAVADIDRLHRIYLNALKEMLA
jgi:succinyl-diaminopimelate desuccinylase